MEEVYIVKLKGLPPPTATSQESLSKDNKTSFYFHTDLTAEAIRGFAYLHIFFGLTVLCLSVTNLCFHENPFMLEPPLGITVWCSVAFILLGFFGILTAYKRKCDLSRSIFYVKILFSIIVVVLSMTLTFIILFALDLHGPIANQFIGLNIIFSIVVESVILLLTLFTTARVLWPGCMNFCAKDWPMQPKFKRKVIVKTNVYAGGIQQDDQNMIQSVGPNCVISLNMPPINSSLSEAHLDKHSSSSSGVSSTANSASSSPSSKTKSLAKACRLSGLCSATSDLTNSSSTLYTVNSDQNHHHNHHHSNYESPQQLAISTHSIYHQKVMASSSVSGSIINSGSTGNLLQTFPTGTQNRKCASTTGLYGNFNRLLYRYSHVNPLQQNGGLYSNGSIYSRYGQDEQQEPTTIPTTERVASASDDVDPYDTDEFDYCSTEDDDDHFNNPADHNYEVPLPIGPNYASQLCVSKSNNAEDNPTSFEQVETNKNSSSKLDNSTIMHYNQSVNEFGGHKSVDSNSTAIVDNKSGSFDPQQSQWSESFDTSPDSCSGGGSKSSMVNIVVNNNNNNSADGNGCAATDASRDGNDQNHKIMTSKTSHENHHLNLNLSDEDDKDEGIESSGSSTCSGEETLPIHQRNHLRLHSFIQQSYKSSIKIESGTDTASDTSSVGSPKAIFESKLTIPSLSASSSTSISPVQSPTLSSPPTISSHKPSIPSKNNLIHSTTLSTNDSAAVCNTSQTTLSSSLSSSGPTIRFLNTTKSSKIVKVVPAVEQAATPTEATAVNNVAHKSAIVSIKPQSTQQQPQQQTSKPNLRKSSIVSSNSDGIVGGAISSKLASHPYLCRLRATNNEENHQVGFERRLTSKFVTKPPPSQSLSSEPVTETLDDSGEETPPDSPLEPPPPSSPVPEDVDDDDNDSNDDEHRLNLPNRYHSIQSKTSSSSSNYSSSYRVPDIQRV